MGEGHTLAFCSGYNPRWFYSAEMRIGRQPFNGLSIQCNCQFIAQHIKNNKYSITIIKLGHEYVFVYSYVV